MKWTYRLLWVGLRYSQVVLYILIPEELSDQSLKVLPSDISRFESHLKQPVRMHNIREKMQKSGKFQPIITQNNAEVIIENGVSVDPINVYAKTQHVYAEVNSSRLASSDHSDTSGS